jgi:hypothetical protein
LRTSGLSLPTALVRGRLIEVQTIDTSSTAPAERRTSLTGDTRGKAGVIDEVDALSI